MLNGEITCSVEETNRIRVALGMKPLRTSTSPEKHPEKLPTLTSPPPLRAAVSSHNGEITCSVEETNRIRVALGLKPLRNATPPAKTEPTEEKKNSKNPDDLQERLTRARRARQTRSRAVAARSIAEEALLEDESDDEPAGREAELAAWVSRSRKIDSEAEISSGTNELSKKRKLPRPVKKEAGGKERSTDPAIPASAAPGEILTLVDAPITGDSKSGKKEEEPEYALENQLTSFKKRPRSPEISGATYDGTDTKEFSSDVKIAPGTVSIEPAGPVVVESDYKDVRARDIEKAFGKRRKRDGSKREKKKRRRLREVEEGVPKEEHQLRIEPTVAKGRMAKLRRAADAQADVGEGSSEDDALYTSLAKARRKAKDREVKSSVDTILEAIDRANVTSGADGNRDDVAADAERSVYNEIEQFLQKIPTADDSSDDDDDEMQITGRGDQNGDLKPKSIAVKRANLGREKTVDKNGQVSVEPGPSTTPVVDPSTSEEKHDTAQPTAQVLGLPVGLNGDVGLAGTLQRLRAMGELKHKPVQIGRARDKRFDSHTTEDETGSRKGGPPEIKLSYTDEYGNELTRKEAFRMLCHKFHGKGPGQNKREKRLRKILEAMTTRNMQADDTPLASAAALKEETRKLGTAHVVLSGPHALSQGLAHSQKLAQSAAKFPSKTKLKSDSEIPDSSNIHEAKEEKVSIAFGMGGRGAKRRRR